jgi:hypothetical protein
VGTNYYVRLPPCESPCAHCRGPEEVHLGKSSMGWSFTFRAWPAREESEHSEIGPVVGDFAAWRRLLDLGEIRDEYGAVHSREELLDRVEAKRGGLSELHGSDFLDGDGNRFVQVDFS